MLAGGERAPRARRSPPRTPPRSSSVAAPLDEAAEALARRARLELATPVPPRARTEDGVGLTTREAEVLALLAEGLTNREIAARLFISSKTVGAHMAHIYAKLDVHSRVQAASRARQLGV